MIQNTYVCIEVEILTAVSTPELSASLLTARRRGFYINAFNVDITAEKLTARVFFTLEIVVLSLVQKYLIMSTFIQMLDY